MKNVLGLAVTAVTAVAAAYVGIAVGANARLGLEVLKFKEELEKEKENKG